MVVALRTKLRRWEGRRLWAGRVVPFALVPLVVILLGFGASNWAGAPVPLKAALILVVTIFVGAILMWVVAHLKIIEITRRVIRYGGD